MIVYYPQPVFTIAEVTGMVATDHYWRNGPLPKGMWGYYRETRNLNAVRWSRSRELGFTF